VCHVGTLPFSFDTRFLSRWVLTVNGERLNPPSVDDLQCFETRFFLVPGTGTVYVDAKLSVIRQRAVGTGLREELTILNYLAEPVDLSVRVDAGCDFADLFEVKSLSPAAQACSTRRRILVASALRSGTAVPSQSSTIAPKRRPSDPGSAGSVLGVPAAGLMSSS
jgi:N-terminal domain of (some) glycogen debranching enzymes